MVDEPGWFDRVKFEPFFKLYLCSTSVIHANIFYAFQYSCYALVVPWNDSIGCNLTQYIKERERVCRAKKDQIDEETYCHEREKK